MPIATSARTRSGRDSGRAGRLPAGGQNDYRRWQRQQRQQRPQRARSAALLLVEIRSPFSSRTVLDGVAVLMLVAVMDVSFLLGRQGKTCGNPGRPTL